MTLLDESLSMFADRMADCIRNRKPVMVVTHMDCDGLASGAIIAKALIRAGAACTVRSSVEFNSGTVEEMSKDGREFHVVTDLAGGFAEDMDAALGDRWVVLDHHHIPDAERDNERVVNGWKYGMDGGVEVCAGGMAYLAAVALDGGNADLAPMAVVAALGDRQDQGKQRSLTGKNQEIAESAKAEGLLSVDLDLLLYGRETRPLPDALAFTSQPYIRGITWERGSCAALLKKADIPLKEKGRWRVPADLTQEEKSAIVNAIARYSPGAGVDDAVAEMVGHTYTLEGEEKGSFMRDCREFGTMLNSCGRIGRAGIGIAVCMGDRGQMLAAAEATLKEYRGRIRECMNILSNDRWRTAVRGAVVMVNADGVVPEAMTGTIASMLSSSPKNVGKVVILRTGGEDNTVKFSSRKSVGCTLPVSLSDVMREGTERFGGVGGGHDMAAGARIGKDRLDEFLEYLEENVNNVPDPG